MFVALTGWLIQCGVSKSADLAASLELVEDTLRPWLLEVELHSSQAGDRQMLLYPNGCPLSSEWRQGLTPSHEADAWVSYAAATLVALAPLLDSLEVGESASLLVRFADVCLQSSDLPLPVLTYNGDKQFNTQRGPCSFVAPL
jgi:hypothetical protein